MEDLSSRYDDHSLLLYQAQNITSTILETLEATASSANIIGESLSSWGSGSSWWPYIWCPTVTLIVGSYGLPPSSLRNLGLLALGGCPLFPNLTRFANSWFQGEISGYIVSQTPYYLPPDYLRAPKLSYFTFSLLNRGSTGNEEPVELCNSTTYYAEIP